MQVVGVWHRIEAPETKKVIEFLEKNVRQGMVIALEYPGRIEELLDEKFNALTPDDKFWRIVAKTIAKKGAKITTVDPPRLYLENFNAASKEEFDRKVLERTAEFTARAKKEKADFLLCGIHHAFDIKKLLGKKANVIFLTPRKEMQEMIQRAGFLKERKARENKNIMQKIAPAARKSRALRL